MRAIFAALLLFNFGDFTFAGENAVVVYLLDHTDKKKTETRFWDDWNNSWRGVVELKKVTGKEADALVALMKKSLLPEEATNFCGHDPIYGIIVKTEDGKTLKTSLCFKCLTWVCPKERLSISGKPGAENKLCIELRKIIELPPELLKKPEK
ncbi:MAG: hypothetical protein ACKVJU_24090 [Verrucomicrobiales bacterium]